MDDKVPTNRSHSTQEEKAQRHKKKSQEKYNKTHTPQTLLSRNPRDSIKLQILRIHDLMARGMGEELRPFHLNLMY
jgi:hypothetical protein